MITDKLCFKMRKFEIIMSILFFNFFIICSVLSDYILFSYLSLIGLTLYFIFMLKIDAVFFVKYLAFIFIAVAAIIGTAITELFSIYLVELQCTSYFTGSLPLLILSYWTLMIVFRICDKRNDFKISLDIKLTLCQKKILQKLVIIVLFIYLLMFIRVIKHPAFLLGIDRFAYSKFYATTGIWTVLLHNAPLLLIFPLLLMIYGNKILGSLTILIYILYSIWVGDKFGPFFTLMCIFFLIYNNKIKEKGRKFISKVIIITIIAFTVLIGFTVYSVKLSSSYTSAQYLLLRGAQQGQLWWKTYDMEKNNAHPFEFIGELKSIMYQKNNIADNVGENYGVYKIMYLCAPKKLVDFKLSTGSRYTEAGYALIYYYFGCIGTVLFSIIMGCIISKTINGFIRSINRNDYIKGLIFLRFFVIERTFMTMLTFSDFIDFFSICSIIYLVIMKNKKITFNRGMKIKIISENKERIIGYGKCE